MIKKRKNSINKYKKTELGKNKMYFYYTYRITNIVENKHYYGFRGTKRNPKYDLGKRYFSSSTDKEFKKLQRTNPEQFKYKIIKVFENKTDAIALEIKLHAKFNVKNHPAFYNLSNQTSTKFETNNKGKPGLKGLENGMSKKINIYNSNRELVFTANGNFGALCKDHNLPVTTLRNSYYNSGVPIFLKKDQNTWAKRNNKDEFIGWYALYDGEQNHTKKEYETLVENEINTIHQNSKIIEIFDENENLKYTVNGVFADFCILHNLPKSALWNSYNKGGEKIFQSNYGKSRATKSGFGKFIGWSAKIKSD